MESRAKIAGHAIHPILIVFPLGLLATAVVFDIIGLVTHHGAWAQASYYMIAAGIIGGLAAAVFGFVDFLAIPRNTRAKSIGLQHGAGNVVVVVLFLVSWLIRRGNPADPGGIAYFFSFVGAALAVVTGWLGGELVERLAVGVDDGANLDAPSSLSARHAGEPRPGGRAPAIR